MKCFSGLIGNNVIILHFLWLIWEHRSYWWCFWFFWYSHWKKSRKLPTVDYEVMISLKIQIFSPLYFCSISNIKSPTFKVMWHSRMSCWSFRAHIHIVDKRDNTRNGGFLSTNSVPIYRPIQNCHPINFLPDRSYFLACIALGLGCPCF